jgi:hypothetical protein
MMNRVILRRHTITLLPDALLFFASLLLLLEIGLMPALSTLALKGICEFTAIVLAMIGFIDVVKWSGFRVVISPEGIAVHRFWIFRDEYCFSGREIAVRLRQNGWGGWLDIGTLTVYETGGSVFTVGGLGNFNMALDSYPQFSP